MRWLRLALILALSIGFSAEAPAAGRRFAFVLGNGAYPALGTLPNPPNDARAIAGALAPLGFDVELHIDLKRDELIGLLPQIAQRARDAELVAFFYAGHGLAIDNQNYIVPIDARLPDDQSDVAAQMVGLARVMDALQGAAKATLIILDSCRNNPYNDDSPGTARAAHFGITRGLAELAGAASRGAGRGLARMDTGGAGLFVAFATKPGEFAYDAPHAGAINSPFTAALVHNVGTPGASLEAVMIRVRREVQDATDRRQLPWTQSSLIDEEVYLAGKPQLSDAALALQQRYQEEVEAKRRAEQQQQSVIAPPSGPPPAAAAPSTSGAPPAEQTAVVPLSAEWAGRWIGQAGKWEVDSTVENGRIKARLTCTGTGGPAIYRFDEELRDLRKVDARARRISITGNGVTAVFPAEIDVAGTFPELTILGHVSGGRCSTETLALQPAKG